MNHIDWGWLPGPDRATLGATPGAALPAVRFHPFLPALMGSLHQRRGTGELLLEQNDGNRRLYWSEGVLVYIRSDAVGEQFGNFLVRRGVLDMVTLRSLLGEEQGSRLGDRVVQLGLLTEEVRDAHLHELLGSVLLHALEHPILRGTWIPGDPDEASLDSLQFHLNHRSLIWGAFRDAKIDRELQDMFRRDPDWRWQAPPDVLDSISDLPLTPTLAYAISLLGSEPLGCVTFAGLSGLPAEEINRLVAALWALGGLVLVQGQQPSVQEEAVPPPVEPVSGPHEQYTPAPPRPSTPPNPPMPPPRAEPLFRRDPEPVWQLDEPEEEAQPYPDLTPLPTPTGLPLVMSTEEEGISVTERARRQLVKAKSYLVQDRTSEAIRALEQAIKLDGDSPWAYEVWLLLGRLRLTNPAWSTRAVEALQTASRLNPRTAEPWALMGELYHRKGYHANAQGCFRRALELDPSVAVPAGWVQDPLPGAPAPDAPSLMGKIKGLFGREKG